jgi:hypothetical protein
MTKHRGDLYAIVALVAIWALVVAFVGVGGDYPLNDDWAYAYSARHLAETGELRILDWAAPSLLTHALWGAAVLRLLGDSYVSLRCGTLAFALAALVLLYALARRGAFTPSSALFVALGLGLSPWFVNLAFTYMTDVPWLAMMLAALLAFSHALRPPLSRRPPAEGIALDPPNRLLLLLTGALLGAASLTRQFAIVTMPAFVLVLAFDARRRHGARWFGPAARDCVLLGFPLLALYAPFQVWYSRVHGVTIANRGSFQRMLEVRPWDVVANGLSAVHYAGLWLLPLAFALFSHGRLGEAVSRRQAGRTLVLLGGFFLVMLLDPVITADDLARPAACIHAFMPYLGNVFYLVGLGPPTLTAAYFGREPIPHANVGLGVALTLLSLFGAVVGAGLVVTIARRVRGVFAATESAQREVAGGQREALRLTVCLFGGVYLLWILCTSTFVFDRYLLPVLPVVLLLGVDAAPPGLTRSPVALACVILTGLFSVALTHEYLSWNDARQRAVQALLVHGIASTDIDGGFEVNGPLYFQPFVERTGKLLPNDGTFWVHNAAYRLSFWPNTLDTSAESPHRSGCVDWGRFPFWTWPGGGERAIYVIHCPKAAS